MNEDLIAYLEDLLATNKAGVSQKLKERSDIIYPQKFSYVELEHPFDINWNEREAYYSGMKYICEDILAKLKNKNEK